MEPAPSYVGTNKMVFELLSDKIKETTLQFRTWQLSAICRIRLNPRTSSVIGGNSEMGYNMLPEMSEIQSILIFDALATSLKPQVPSVYISTRQENKANSIVLFNSVTNLAAQIEFYTIKKNPAQKMDKYFAAFKHAYAYSHLKLQPRELTIHYMPSLHQTSLFDTIFNIGHGGKTDWWKDGLEANHHKVKEYL